MTPAPAIILVVEDEALLRAVTCEHLRDCGFTVAEAANGDEAITILQSGTTVNVVFADVRMPGETDGLALAEFVRQHHPEIGLFMTSGYTTHARPAVDRLADSPLIDKPYDLCVVIGLIEAFLARRGHPEKSI